MTSIQLNKLSTRARNVLTLAHLNTLEDVAAYGAPAILRLPNCGRTTLKEISDLLAKNGLSFAKKHKPVPIEEGAGRFWTHARMKKAKAMLEAGNNPSKVARYFGKDNGPNMMLALRRYGYWPKETASLVDLLKGNGTALCRDAAARIEELERYKSLHAQCDKVALHLENKLKDQVSRYYGEAHKYEKALRLIVETLPSCLQKEIARAALGMKDGD